VDLPSGRGADLAGPDLVGAAEFATQVAAMVVTRFGARPV
jgi:sugar/nucleoside kinase (ribokinase family)